MLKDFSPNAWAAIRRRKAFLLSRIFSESELIAYRSAIVVQIAATGQPSRGA